LISLFYNNQFTGTSLGSVIHFDEVNA
jgi:hypothetical protein